MKLHDSQDEKIRILPPMLIRRVSALSFSTRRLLVRAGIAAGLHVLLVSCLAVAQATPTEDFGPYNAIFLPDGPGLTKQLAAPSPLDNRTAALLDRLGLNKEPDQHDVLLQGRATWSLTFWFNASEPLQDA